MIAAGPTGQVSSDPIAVSHDVPVAQLDTRTLQLLATFYGTLRAGYQRLSDGGGPLGFDITKALLLDVLYQACPPTAIVETGCHTGDTTAYLGRMYQDVPILSCDIEPAYASIARHRTRHLANVSVQREDARSLVGRATRLSPAPWFYLDAHWNADWPILDELRLITSGVVIIDDFDIEHPRFSYDSYAGVACDAQLLSEANESMRRCLTYPNVDYNWPLPCLQNGRRSGWGVIVFDDAVRDSLIERGYLVDPRGCTWR